MGSATTSPPIARPKTAPPALTIADELARIAPGLGLQELCRWPPDTFAFTGTVLADSGAYRCVVSPPPGCSWPPAQYEGGPGWEAELREIGGAWASGSEQGEVPPGVRSVYEAVDLGVPLPELDDPRRWGTLAALLRLHALADEACAGAGIATATAFQRLAGERLAAAGSLASISPDRLRVLPKLRPPASGMTLRSLSHNVALDRSEVSTNWVVAPPPERASQGPERLTLLLIPHPAVIHASDFVTISESVAAGDREGYGYYEFAPQERFNLPRALELVRRARRAVGEIDLVVLPESALEAAELPAVQAALAGAGVPYLIAGIREGRSPGGLGSNYAYFGARDWHAPPQHKHHRWCVDTSQVHQYHLGAALEPGRRWWEAIALPRRSLTFVTIFDRLAICPLVCEDLARPDPVTDVVRSIAPTLVVGLLLDGPQLASRWPARYASVLADDPGCSVLTLTALGMTRRSLPPGQPPSRAVALWKDPRRGLQEIALAEDASAVALTAHVQSAQADSADGRAGRPVAELVLSGIEQIA